jgi:hypothetical protein
VRFSIGQLFIKICLRKHSRRVGGCSGIMKVVGGRLGSLKVVGGRSGISVKVGW